MKMLLVMHYAPPHIGGMEAIIKKQAENLVSYGNDVTILTCKHDPLLPNVEHVDAGYRIIRLRAYNFIEKQFGMAFPIISPLALLLILKEVVRHDVIHIHDSFYMTSHFSLLASLLTRKPIYVTQHVAIVDHPRRAVKSIQNAIQKTIGRLLFMSAKGIVVYNTNVAQFLKSLNIQSSKIITTPNGIDTDFFTPVTLTQKKELRKKYNLPENKDVVLFVGRLIPEKGYHLVSQLGSPKYTTLIVGGGTVDKSLKATAGVVYYGPASQDTLKELYQLSSLFVFPATVEVFALVMQEAMAAGLPIITTNNNHYYTYPLNLELFTLTPPTIDQITHHVDRLLRNKKLHRKISNYSRNYAVQNFSWNKNYVDEYKIYGAEL